jgi:hypothetical protein
MPGFSDLFGSDDSDTLPEWLQGVGAVVEAGLDIYGEIASGQSQPPPQPIYEQRPAAAAPWGATNSMLLWAAAIGVFIYFSSRKR